MSRMNMVEASQLHFTPLSRSCLKQALVSNTFPRCILQHGTEILMHKVEMVWNPPIIRFHSGPIHGIFLVGLEQVLHGVQSLMDRMYAGGMTRFVHTLPSRITGNHTTN